jgi:3-hydroxyacyl-CoA dehydrogenase
MRLLEIVRGKATASDVIAASMALARRLGKIGVLAGNCRGFIGNRMYALYQREAQFLVEEGASVSAVDAALHGFGMAMGPLATGDLSGLDIGYRIRNEYRHLEQPGVRQPRMADRLCERGRFGQKTAAGWYRYEAGNRTPFPDPEVERIVAEFVEQAGIPQRAAGSDEIVERTIYALVNEGARLLEEGIALRAGDIDIVYVNGYGFPAHRGGPMWYADTVGLARVHERVLQFESQHGSLWKPAPLLTRLAEEGRTFADLDREQMG